MPKKKKMVSLEPDKKPVPHFRPLTTAQMKAAAPMLIQTGAIQHVYSAPRKLFRWVIVAVVFFIGVGIVYSLKGWLI